MSGKRRKITWRVTSRGCHECTSHVARSDGYPTLWKNGKSRHMHRVLYEEAYGPLGELLARHACDNTLCINLAHVELGTAADNSRDRKERGRSNVLRGEARADAKLTLTQVAMITRSKASQRHLAEMFGVNQSTISRIQNHKRWPDRKGVPYVSLWRGGRRRRGAGKNLDSA